MIVFEGNHRSGFDFVGNFIAVAKTLSAGINIVFGNWVAVPIVGVDAVFGN